jgi:LCP family protein required for cell wall assembly
VTEQRGTQARPATAAPDQAPAPRRGLRIVAGVVSASVLLGSGVAWAGVNRYVGQVTRIAIPGLSGNDDAPSAPETILVVASDSRQGITRSEAAALHLGTADYGKPRTDTMMLVHISANADAVTVVSLPRDTLATIPAYKGKPAHQAKLNAAYEQGGAPLMVKTVTQLTGVPIDHYVEINFNGFLKMVDAVGGVEVCLASPMKDKKSGLNLPAGRQTITGPQSLAYVRARYVDPSADLGRMKRQQKFVASIVKKATSVGTLLNPVKLNGFLSAVAGSITTDSGLGQDQLLALADRLKGTNPANVAFMTVPIAGDKRMAHLGDVLLWDPTKSAQLFSAIRKDTPIVPPTTKTGTSAPVVTVAPGQVTVKVLNGTSTAGLGHKAADDLSALGFGIAGAAGNAPANVGAATVITYDPRYDQSAKTVAAAIPGSTLTAQAGLGKTITVTVGTSYTGAKKVTVGKASTTPTTTIVKTRTAAQDTCS